MDNKTIKRTNISRVFYYASFLLATFAIIYLLFPKQVTFKYEFQKGQPWSHETLIAPFDFPVMKPKELLQAELDSVMKNYVPFIHINVELENEQLTLLREQLDKIFQTTTELSDPDLQEYIVSRLEEILSSIYHCGILENSVDKYDYLNEKTQVNLVLGNVAQIVPISKLFSLKSAYLALNDTINRLAAESDECRLIQRHFDPAQFIVANTFYDKLFNEEQIKELQQSVSATRGAVQSGVRIISEGDWVTNENFLVLESLKQAYERNRSYSGWISTIIIGQMILILIVIGMMVLYLQTYNRDLFWKKRNFTMILFTILAIFLLARLVHSNTSLSMYLLPVCILPIIIRTFLGARMAIFIHLSTMLIISFMAPNSFEFFFLQSVAGVIAVVSLRRMHRRGQLFLTSLYVFISYCLNYFAFELIKEGLLIDINWETYKWFFVNGLLLTSAYLIVYIIEKIFGFISDVTLVELSDTNNPLLRKLAETAPGTFQHSMQVANLAEAVIYRIGGNPLLVRTGALYHDIGKINSSEFFIENQQGGPNPHDGITHVKSVEKIVSHVFDGVKLAKKHKLPNPIIDFIKMHHGTGLVKYFYLKYKEEHPDEVVNEDDFRYPGPNPTTRETAVVMLADGVEAAARSISEKNEESLKTIINQIIDVKVAHHELDDAPLTFKDIKAIKAIFLEKLKNVYHIRIQYPKEIES